MTDNYKRIEGEMPLRQAVVAVLGANAAPASSEWTDEQWAAHDAQINANNMAFDAQLEAERVRDVIEEMIARDGWPRRAIEAALAADESKSAIMKIRGVDMSDRNIIVVSGAPGCGKTVGAAWWALRRKTSTKFVRASTFAAASRYDRQERTVWLKASALVLDDAGAEYSDAKGSLMVDLDELLDTFYGDRRPLLITTNCSVADFKTRYGERITDRLRECGRWISVDGGSLRKKT